MTVSARLLPDGLKVEISELCITLRLNIDGYWCSVRFGDRLYRRCLNGKVIVGVDQVVDSDTDLQQLCKRVKSLCSDLLAAGIELDKRAFACIEKATQLSLKHYQHQSQLYKKSYPESVPVLPPDRYRDLVVPLTTGCPNSKCTFCAFYRAKPFRVFSDDELEQRLQDILHLVPSGVAGRQGVFLGSANALAIPVARLKFLLSEIGEFLGYAERGVACFGDADHIGKRTNQDWELLYTVGLRRVVIGLESGNPDLRSVLGKSANLDKTRHLVAGLKGAGVTVGLTVLTGVCDKTVLHDHFEDTCAFLQLLNLGVEDSVYISPWFSGGVRPSVQAVSEAKELKMLLKTNIDARVTLYSSHNFHYFS